MNPAVIFSHETISAKASSRIISTTQPLQGKVALVTGGSRSIGAAIVQRLAREGAHVALTHSRSPERAEEVLRAVASGGGKTLAIQADSADPHAVTEAVERTARELGGLDILVNNAGVAIFAPLAGYQLSDFEQTFAINVRAVFVATQAAARHMREGGCIINIGRTNAERMPSLDGGVYAMSKAALQGTLVPRPPRDTPMACSLWAGRAPALWRWAGTLVVSMYKASRSSPKVSLMRCHIVA